MMRYVLGGVGFVVLLSGMVTGVSVVQRHEDTPRNVFMWCVFECTIAVLIFALLCWVFQP